MGASCNGDDDDDDDDDDEDDDDHDHVDDHDEEDAMKTTLRMTRTMTMTMPMVITMMGTAMRVMGTVSDDGDGLDSDGADDREGESFLSATLAGPVRAKNLRL